MRQMPTEGKMFQAVDATWRRSMAETFSEPHCIKVARRPGFLASLIDANNKLEQIQKGPFFFVCYVYVKYILVVFC